jgi:predicted DNA-binding antitoxin AbrB/MazE fold protein
MKITGRMPVPRVVEAEYEKGMLKPSTPLTLRPGERVPLIVMRQSDSKRWDLSRLAQSPAADEAVLAEQGLEGWAANLDAEDRRSPFPPWEVLNWNSAATEFYRSLGAVFDRDRFPVLLMGSAFEKFASSN